MNRKRLRLLAPLFAASLAVTLVACDPDGDEEPGPDPGDDFPRHETLITTGSEWGTFSNWNPFTPSGWATGAMGLVYENLFLFDPHTLELEPNLAASGEWTSDDTYVIQLRDGIEWHDGTPFTAEDVKYTLDLRLADSIAYSNTRDWIEEVEADGLTVTVTFSDPRKGEWDNMLMARYIGPKHLWEQFDPEDINAEPGTHDIVGTGAFTYVRHDDDRAVYERNDAWWGTSEFGEMAMKYVIDLGNPGHNAIAGDELLAGNIDLSNNFLPVEFVRDNDFIEAYRDEEPYMIEWNTAYLILNHEIPPLDDPEFRRAMAFAINVPDIVDTAYAGLVAASHPTGLLPAWVNQGMVDDAAMAEHGWEFNPDEANAILDGAGYDYDGDWRATPDGDPIALTVIVPDGWTDWNISSEIIAESLQAVGLNVQFEWPSAPEVDEARNNGDFELVVNNWTAISNHPYAVNWNYLYRLPIEDVMNPDNFGRYENAQAWQLTQDFATLSVAERDADFDSIHGQLQEIALRDMPAIPMWYNGLWAQWNTTYWTGWPKQANNGPMPSMWNDVGEKGRIKMLAQLEPTGVE